MVKPVIVTLALLLFCACSANRNDTGHSDAADSADSIQLDTAEIQGKWQLQSYSIDDHTTSFDASPRYALSFNKTDNTFGLTTDCNLIGGLFVITNDTIRFTNTSVTEMACDDMTVEENMLRLLNDATTYAVYSPDTLRLYASDGNAIFIKPDAESMSE